MRMNMKVFAVAACLLSAVGGMAQVGIVGALTHEYSAVPGNSYEGSIEVNNPGEEEQEIKVYQTDYIFYADGTVVYGNPGDLPRSNARWITLSPKQVIIPPKETIAVHFTIQAPDDETLKGTYWSVIMLEPIAKGSPESSSPGSSRPSITVVEVLRYAIQVVTNFGESGTRSIKFGQMRLTAEDGRRSLSVDVENTGERWLRGGLWIDLYDSDGKYVGKYEGTRKRMYPQTSARYSVDLVGLANGSYKALIIVDCGGDDVFGINVNLVLKD